MLEHGPVTIGLPVRFLYGGHEWFELDRQIFRRPEKSADLTSQ
jgi:hypothetical protein